MEIISIGYKRDNHFDITADRPEFDGSKSARYGRAADFRVPAAKAAEPYSRRSDQD
jgi:hypothetical protein